jgi:hypothetical protein
MMGISPPANARKLGLFRTIGSCCKCPFNPQSDHSAEGGRRLPGAVPEIRNPQFIWHPSSCLFLPFSDHKSSIRGATSGQSVPPSMARVARIVTEFCVLVMPQNRASPCARWNKEFLTRGVLCPFNCCTNVAIRRLGCAHQLVRDSPNDKWWAPPTLQRPRLLRPPLGPRPLGGVMAIISTCHGCPRAVFSSA